MEHGLVTYFRRLSKSHPELHPESRGIRMWSPELGDFTRDKSAEAVTIRKGMEVVAEALCKDVAAKMAAKGFTESGEELSRRERSLTPTISATPTVSAKCK